MPFASSSVRVHLLRGVLGLACFVGAFAGVGVLGPAALLLALAGVAAWRGCPTCWAIGLAETRRRVSTQRPREEAGSRSRPSSCRCVVDK